MPLLAFAQEKLLEKAQAHGGVLKYQPTVIISTASGKPENLKMDVNMRDKNFDVAVHIDAKNHNVYCGENNAHRLFSVPLDKTATLLLLKETADLKHCAAKALQHSRELLLRYLAGLGKD